MLVVCRAVSLGDPGSSSDGLNFTVSAGEVCTIVGSSASGKTRLCELLSGLRRPAGGVIVVDGRNLADDRRSGRHRVTYVVPEAPLWPSRSITSNIEYVLRLGGLPKPSDDETIHALRLAEVPDRLFDGPIQKLSHFNRFGVWLAIHRLRQVPVLLMDDPFVKLTGWETESLAQLIRAAAGGGGCAVITSGSADVPAVVADHRYRLVRGRLIPISTPTSWTDADTDVSRTRPGRVS